MFFTKIFGLKEKPKTTKEEAEKAFSELKGLFATDMFIPLEAEDNLNIIFKYVQECAPKEDIKAALREIKAKRDAFRAAGCKVEEDCMNDVLKTFEVHTDIIEELEHGL